MYFLLKKKHNIQSSNLIPRIFMRAWERDYCDLQTNQHNYVHESMHFITTFAACSCARTSASKARWRLLHVEVATDVLDSNITPGPYSIIICIYNSKNLEFGC